MHDWHKLCKDEPKTAYPGKFYFLLKNTFCAACIHILAFLNDPYSFEYDECDDRNVSIRHSDF